MINEPVVAWLEQPKYKSGLDNIGTQQPCVLIYSYLLPGITNVTDRAIYFGFYPWFICAFEKRYPDASEAEFRNELRKADCLLTLIAHRHAIALNDGDDAAHGATCPGSRKLRPAAAELSEDNNPIRLTKFSAADESNVHRYFKNSLGGLGQYYLGSLRDEHHVLAGEVRTGVKYTNEIGGPIADSFAQGLDEEQFFRLLDADDISIADLDLLSMFCPCSIAKGERAGAQHKLIELMFGDIYGQSDAQRRRTTLALILRFFRDHGGHSAEDAVEAFLACCYSQSLDGNLVWQLPDALADTRELVALYLRNEMLSLSWLALFKTALDCLDGLPKPIFDVGGAAGWLVDQDEFSIRPEGGFDGLVEKCSKELPPLAAFLDDKHEVALWLKLIRGKNNLVATAIRLLATLLARHGMPTACYKPAHITAKALADYPLTLDTFSASAKRWKGQSSEEWLKSLLIEVLSAHRRVAIRKLGQSGENTLMFRVGEEGLFVDRPLERVPQTQPRIRQAFQILRDLGLPIAPSRGTLLHFRLR